MPAALQSSRKVASTSSARPRNRRSAARAVGRVAGKLRQPRRLAVAKARPCAPEGRAADAGADARRLPKGVPSGRQGLRIAAVHAGPDWRRVGYWPATNAGGGGEPAESVITS